MSKNAAEPVEEPEYVNEGEEEEEEESDEYEDIEVRTAPLPTAQLRSASAMP